VAAEMGLGSTGGDAVRAGRLFLERIDEAVGLRESVLVESTLSGLGTSRLIRRFRQAGYLISIEEVFVGSADQCVARIRGRVQRGGHHVPEADVRRRFKRSLINFWERYRFEADRWRLYYNGVVGPVLVIEGQGAEALVVEPSLFERFLPLLEA
jgi:predicted ABC-type ATPase